MRIPAFCDDCGTAFRSPFNVSGRVMALTLEGNKVGPCPACGGLGSIPDGTFDFIDGAVRILARPQRTVDDLRTLALILEDAKIGAITQEESISRITESVPDLTNPVLGLLPNSQKMLPWIATLAAVISTVIAFKVMLNPSESPTTINTDINVTVEKELTEEQLSEIIEKIFDRLVEPEEPEAEEEP